MRYYLFQVSSWRSCSVISVVGAHTLTKGRERKDKRKSMWFRRVIQKSLGTACDLTGDWIYGLLFLSSFLPRLSYWPSEQRLLLKSKLTLIQWETKWEEKPSFDSIYITNHFNLFAFCDINYCFLRYFHSFCDIWFALRLLAL